MKQYLKMADVFGGTITVSSGSRERLISHSGDVVATSSSQSVAKYAAHAINSHDDLALMLAVMAELVGKINCYCYQSGSSAKANSENPVESWMAEANEALNAYRSAS